VSPEVKVAVAGAGFWAGYQTAAWQELPGVRVAAVCDRDRARAEKLAALRGIPGVYADTAGMLDRERPDLLDVVTDPAGHAPVVKLAADKRVPVVCQKPMTPTLAGCEELVVVCRRAGAFFAVHENWRWQAPLRAVKAVLDAGTIGPPFRGRIDFVSGFDVFANQPGLKNEERFILADMGCHLFDLARCLFGEAEAVYCRTARVRPDIRGEDVATAVLQAANTTVTVNMAYAGTPLEVDPFPETLLFAEGPRGSVELSAGCRLRVTTAEGTRVTRVPPPRYTWANPDYAVVHASVVACHADILDALRAGRPAATDGADNLKTMRLVEAAYESAATGTAIRFDSFASRTQPNL
jgi:predicted dehydrogenase